MSQSVSECAQTYSLGPLTQKNTIHQNTVKDIFILQVTKKSLLHHVIHASTNNMLGRIDTFTAKLDLCNDTKVPTFETYTSEDYTLSKVIGSISAVATPIHTFSACFSS